MESDGEVIPGRQRSVEVESSKTRLSSRWQHQAGRGGESRTCRRMCTPCELCTQGPTGCPTSYVVSCHITERPWKSCPTSTACKGRFRWQARPLKKTIPLISEDSKQFRQCGGSTRGVRKNGWAISEYNPTSNFFSPGIISRSAMVFSINFWLPFREVLSLQFLFQSGNSAGPIYNIFTHMWASHEDPKLFDSNSCRFSSDPPWAWFLIPAHLYPVFREFKIEAGWTTGR